MAGCFSKASGIAILALALCGPFQGATAGGAVFREADVVGKQTIPLRGTGVLHYMVFIKAYAAVLYLPNFYADIVGINVTAMGVILARVRLFDAINDPLMGYASDRTQSRFGRRKPYIFAGSVCVALAILLLFNPPPASSLFETVWFGIGIYALFLFWTVVTVPYESLGPELTFDHARRNTLFALRDGMLIAGTLAAAASPTLIRQALGLPPDAAGEWEVFFWISMICAPLVIVCAGWCTLTLQERPARSGIVFYLNCEVVGLAACLFVWLRAGAGRWSAERTLTAMAAAPLTAIVFCSHTGMEGSGRDSSGDTPAGCMARHLWTSRSFATLTETYLLFFRLLRCCHDRSPEPEDGCSGTAVLLHRGGADGARFTFDPHRHRG